MEIPSIFPATPAVFTGISPMAHGVKNAHRRKTRRYRANWMSGNKTKTQKFQFQKPQEMNRLEILEKVGFDLEKAKAIHQWLNEGTAAQPAAQTDSTPDGITIVDRDGEKWVRVKVLDEDFLIAAHDYTEGGKDEFEWQDAMDAMAKIGRTMWNKKQMTIAAAFKDEINAKLKDIDGDLLDGYYWSSTESNSYNAWLVYFSDGRINLNGYKYYSLPVRPCAAFNS